MFLYAKIQLFSEKCKSSRGKFCTFRDFFREAAEELILISSLVEK